MSDSRPRGLSVKAHEDIGITEEVDMRKDFGSEQLPVDVVENPWDVPARPGGVPPSHLVAGNGEVAAATGEPPTSNE